MRAPALHRLLPVLAVIAAATCLGVAPSAEAAFGPIQLISKTPQEQSGEAGEPAISADGRYVAFCATLGGDEGVFRERLETGAVEPVAIAPISLTRLSCEPTATSAFSYATAPSISADGRYVAFTTHESLVAADTEAETSDVYLADMDSSPPTYRLVSAADEGEEPMSGGSSALGGSAISADGDRVVFLNGGNVYVREISAERTILISARRDADGVMTTEPAVGGGAYEPAGASISADGSTVAWVGEHLPQQVPLLGDEKAAIEHIEAGPVSMFNKFNQYHEPLWRRVPSLAEGGEAPPTRRIVGGGDPEAPGCPPLGTLEEVACQGPYPMSAFNHREEQISEPNGFGWGLELPKLDADGDEVALAGDPDAGYDLFVIDMEEGLDRREAVHQVTQWTNPHPGSPQDGGKFDWEIIRGGNFGEYLPIAGAVTGCAISADGTHVAFTTTRQQFSTLPYVLITGIPPAVSLLPELYELNLEGDTIERATPGGGQNVSEIGQSPGQAQGANAPSFGGDSLIAFASDADNLIDGDGNEASDVFTVESSPATPVGQSAISPPPPPPAPPSGWRMTASAFSRPDGEVRVEAHVPAAGTLRAAARAQVGSRLKSRQVATARRRPKAASVVSFDLKLGRGRRALARKPGLVARIRMTFAGPGGAPLHADLQGRFVVHRKRPAKHSKAAAK